MADDIRAMTELRLGEEYRSARRLSSGLCVLGIGWSAAQFEIGSLQLGSAGPIDISGASIPFVLACGVLYTAAKTVIGYAMQQKEVRQWQLAQIDFQIFSYLLRGTLVMLAAAGLHRSIDTLFLVAGGAILLIFGSLVLIFLGSMAIFSVLFFFKWQGPSFPYSYLAGSLFWTEWLVLFLVILLLAGLGYASVNHEALLVLWTEPPDPLSVAVFVVTTIAIVISIRFQNLATYKLFARELPKLTKHPDGTFEITYPNKKQVE